MPFWIMNHGLYHVYILHIISIHYLYKWYLYVGFCWINPNLKTINPTAANPPLVRKVAKPWGLNSAQDNWAAWSWRSTWWPKAVGSWFRRASREPGPPTTLLKLEEGWYKSHSKPIGFQTEISKDIWKWKYSTQGWRHPLKAPFLNHALSVGRLHNIAVRKSFVLKIHCI